jgi:hypothetical protein
MSRSVTLSCNSANDLKDKIAAIKGVRSLTGAGLREAKELVERVTPGHSEILIVGNVLEPRYGESLQLIRTSGLTVTVAEHNVRARNEIGDMIRGIVTYATMAAQYDVSRALLDLMETYCPEPSDKFIEDENNDKENKRK